LPSEDLSSMLVKIAICSDLHADTTLANDLLPRLVAEYVATLGVDAMIICGDLSAQKSRFATALQELRHAGCPIGFVPGNHDVWQMPEDARPWEDSWSKLDWIIESCHTAGIQFLGDWVLGGDVFITGTIGWYDYSFAKPDLVNIVGINAYEEKYIPGFTWLDADFVKWGVPDRDVCASYNKEFNDRLAHHANFLPTAHRATVVVTHVVPFLEGVTYKGDLNWDFSCAFMGNKDLGDIILQHALPLNVTHILFGHTHTPQKFCIGGIRCHCQPFGFFPKLDPNESNLRDIVQRTVQVIDRCVIFFSYVMLASCDKKSPPPIQSKRSGRHSCRIKRAQEEHKLSFFLLFWC